MTQPISRLRIPASTDLPEDVNALHIRAEEKLGFVPNVMRAWALRPQHLMAWRTHYDLIMGGESKLSKAQREMIAVTVSSLNRCHYCSTTHPAMLRSALRKEGRDPNMDVELQFDPLEADLTPAEKAMLEFAMLVTLDSSSIDNSDIETLRRYGFDDETIFDIAEITAMFNFTNRLANATGIRPNPEYHRIGRE
jgi:uncharacterized peroxidase-related enzyme